MSLIEVQMLVFDALSARIDGHERSFVPTTWDPHARLRGTLKSRMDAAVGTRKLVPLRKFWYEDGDLQLELFPASSGNKFIVCRVHSAMLAADSKSARQFIAHALTIPDRTVQVDYTDVDAADIVCMLDAIYHPETMILDFEAPQWTAVFKAALHFNLIRLLRRAAAHLEELLPATAIWALGAAYQYRRWLPPGVAPARPRKYGLTHPTWCIPWELTPAERVLFRRFGKWAPRTYVRRIDEPEIMEELKRAREEEEAIAEGEDQPSTKRSRREMI